MYGCRQEENLVVVSVCLAVAHRQVGFRSLAITHTIPLEKYGRLPLRGAVWVLR